MQTSYADAFNVLAENSVIDSELLAAMDRMAKFRNVVVHQYGEVDAEVVLAILRKRLTDVERYVTVLLAWLKKSAE